MISLFDALVISGFSFEQAVETSTAFNTMSVCVSVRYLPLSTPFIVIAFPRDFCPRLFALFPGVVGDGTPGLVNR